MKKFFHARLVAFLLLALLLINAVVYAATEDLSLDQLFQALYFESLADSYYQTREIPDHLETAIRYYRKAIEIGPQSSESYWKITRCYWVLTNKRAGKQEIRERLYKSGMNYGKKSIAATPKNANAYTWNALIHGNYALEQGVMNAIYTRHQLKNWLDKALEIDSRNINALLGLAGWFFYVPELFGGDKGETFRLIDQAIGIDPNYTAIYIQQAEHLIEDKRYASARKALQTIFQIEHPTLPNDTIEDKAIANTLLAKISEIE